MGLIQLIYVSKSIGDTDFVALKRILESADRHNVAQQVTGMLLYTHGSFMQVLEGEEPVIDETMARIKLDPRHTDITVLVRSPIDERCFERWSMGFKRLGAEELAASPAYAPFFEHGFDAASIGARPGLALEILVSFAENLPASRLP